ncbi:bifunctional diguanylate cyclase/phosphodiesterase [Priestia taiwanensis]|uniref:GGDEF domain-containing protein n=1 Tax=Priestia taiwanensis TaxID=1347902 RepID=A0A917ARJ0_9BACI|nr:bifunctional diguanylate cyclase/phosphodiesterase [Priestia taiwanensis]MBM7363074.1 diguanylate cyclase (GGDEF)-like protein/PAS domain S-box-containing protein [Priestia taiwanensis]GGE67479.1 GGDEF domain-containing protein [Priestia taiwanensis]
MNETKNKNLMHSTAQSLYLNEDFIESMEEIVFIVKVEGPNLFSYQFANSIAVKYLNLGEDYIGKTFHEVQNEEVANKLQANHEQVVKKKANIHFSEEIQLVSGEMMYGETTLNPVVDEEQVCRYILTVIRDMTSRRFEKDLLNQSLLRYRSLIDYNMDAILTVDCRGIITQTNPATTMMFGYEDDSLLGTSIFELIHQSSIESFRMMLNNTLFGQPAVMNTCQFIHADKTERIMNVRFVPIMIDDTVDEFYLMARDVTEEKQKEKTIEYLAYYDALTGFYNRACFIEDIKEVFEIAKEQKQTFALMYMDLDRLKFVNDSLGHDAGDMILKELAARFKKIVSKNPNLAAYRQGGDEFIILSRDTNKEQVELLAKELVEAMREPFHCMGERLNMTLSIGISMYPENGTDVEMLVKKADIALYDIKHKQHRKQTYTFYYEECQQTALHVFNIERYLRRAVENNEFVLHYQPQLNVETGELIGLEALIRWNSKELGMVPPGEFIPIAEEAECIIEIGNWVIANVCQQIKEWNDQNYCIKQVAINLSPLQVETLDIVETIEHHLHINGLSPSQLVIEITESAMKNRTRTAAVLWKLKELGVGISIDDFGTGYSSLSYLAAFPIDMLKIDRSFIQEVGKEKKEEAITTTIIYMAKILGLEVIAEGVEEQSQVDFLKKQECMKAQGFYFSRPVPSEEIVKLFFTNKD